MMTMLIIPETVMKLIKQPVRAIIFGIILALVTSIFAVPSNTVV